VVVETKESALDGPVEPVVASRGAEFAAWVAPHLSALTAVATHQLGRNDAADVVQETLLRAWRRWNTYRPDRGSPRAWLLAILGDQLRRYRMRRRPRGEVFVADDSSAWPVISAETGPRLDLERAVRQLPKRQQQVVVLHYLADLGVQEVAGLLGISDGSVKSHLSAARDALRIALEER
jgi:RNA polymerase sigma-70 factor (ECF subfamily)